MSCTLSNKHETPRKTRVDVRWALIGILFVGLMGYDLRFAFEANSRSTTVACFCPVNKSAWEQLKLVLMPTYTWLLISLVIWFRHDFDENINAIGSFALAVGLGILAGMLYMLCTYYSDKGSDAYNIANQAVAVVIVHTLAVWLFPRLSALSAYNIHYSAVLFTTLHTVFLVFTFFPPHAGIFRDFVTGEYGIAI